jgi:hypothetical protein
MSISKIGRQVGHLDGFLEGQDAGRKADLGDEYLAQHDLVFATLRSVLPADPGAL